MSEDRNAESGQLAGAGLHKRLVAIEERLTKLEEIIQASSAACFEELLAEAMEDGE